MASKKHLLLLASAATIAFTTSCVDDAYDLSDMDTTVGLNVNELTIPLNIESVTLDKILDIEEDGNIKREIVNGKEIYAFVQEGSFKSNAIKIPGFITESPEIEPIIDVLKRQDVEPSNANTRGARNGSTAAGSYPINENSTTEFSTSGDVDPSIIGINRISVNAKYNIHIDVADTELKEKVNKVRFENFITQAPKGLEATLTLKTEKETKDVSSKYDTETGILDLSDEEIQTSDCVLDVTVIIKSIDISKAGKDVVFKNGKFEFNGEIRVISGNIVVYTDDMKDGISIDQLPDEIGYVCTPTFSDIEVTQVSGEIQYDIKGINIDPVMMNDMPDILKQEDTDIRLKNPQIYLALNNPLSDYKVKAQAGLELIAKRKNVTTNRALSEIIVIDQPNNVFCLTPDGNLPKEELQKGYKDAKMVAFNGFGDILSGNQIPQQIEINVVNPELPIQKVENFDLNQQNIDPLEGTYMFFAPLAINESSMISYKDTLDGWNDETLEKLEISKASVKANIKSEIPLNLALTIRPINTNGKVISGVSCNEVKIDATNKSQPVEFIIQGNINDLDGIIISAKITGADGEAISPVDRITLDDFKVTVSGKYIDEF